MVFVYSSSSKQNLDRVFRLHKKTFRVILNFNYRGSCRDAFKELGFLTRFINKLPKSINYTLYVKLSETGFKSLMVSASFILWTR